MRSVHELPVSIPWKASVNSVLGLEELLQLRCGRQGLVDAQSWEMLLYEAAVFPLRSSFPH